jgi:phage tail sheath protein FI
LIVRLYKAAAGSDGKSRLTVKGAAGAELKLEAANPGAWGDKLSATVDYDGITDEVAQRYGLTKADLFNLTVSYTTSQGVSKERIINVSVKDGPRRVDRALEAESQWVRVSKKEDGSPDLPASIPPDQAKGTGSGGKDTQDLDAAAFKGDADKKTGLNALKKADLFNLLCIPPDKRDGDTPAEVYQAAMKYCADRRAMLIVDSPATWSKVKETAAATAKSKLSDLGLTGTDARNAALYFPRIVRADPLREGQLDTFVPCGAIAGIMARTDQQRGVWKAPAGLDAAIGGIQKLEANLTDLENGMLNPLGINCLRFFPVSGRVVWGARTLRGADQLADEYKYVPVRRLALYIEESLYRGTQWVVFEPNDEPLWAQIRLNVGAFMHNLFRQGAFQGTTPREAYFVKCDKETTTPTDINLGIVNIVVGFAPLKPAEFVIIKIQQIAAQSEV